MNISELPTEMLMEIFKHLDRTSLVMVAQVSYHWYQTSSAPTVWSSTELKIRTIHDIEHLQRNKLSMIKSVHLSIPYHNTTQNQENENDKIIVQLMRQLPNSVREIKGQYAIKKFQPKEFHHVRRVYNNLRSIHICNGPFGSEHLSIILNDISQREPIDDLLLILTCLTDIPMTTFLNAACNTKHLHIYHYWRRSEEYKTKSHIKELFKKLALGHPATKTESIHICNEIHQIMDASLIGKALSNMRKVQIDLSDTPIHDLNLILKLLVSKDSKLIELAIGGLNRCTIQGLDKTVHNQLKRKVGRFYWQRSSYRTMYLQIRMGAGAQI